MWPPCESGEKDGKDPSGLISGGEREVLMCIASGPWENGQNKSLNHEMPLPSCDNKKKSPYTLPHVLTVIINVAAMIIIIIIRMMLAIR